MSYKVLQLRRDTAANWTTNNPTLAAGEIGIETDTLKFKLVMVVQFGHHLGMLLPLLLLSKKL